MPHDGQSYLGHRVIRVIRDPATERDLMTMRRRAWLELGIAVIRIEDIGNEVEQKFLKDVASRLYGKRRG